MSSSSSSSSLFRFPRRRHPRPFCSSASPSTATADPDPPSAADPTPKTPGRKSPNQIVDSLLRERDLDGLVSAFKEASALPRFRRKHLIYDDTVRRLAAAGRLDGVAAILEAQKGYPGDVAREGFAARLIRLYGRAGMAAAAEETFRQLPALGCPRTVISFNALLSACAEAGEFERVDEVFRSVPAEEPGIAPDDVSYSVVIGSMCKRSDLDAAMRMLEVMEERGVQPSLITFNILLNGCYKNGHFSDAEKVWTKMAKKDCKPDVKSFNAKVRGLAMAGRTPEAAKLVAQLPSTGLKPDIFSFNFLINGYCQDGNLADAQTVFEDLPKNDCYPNRETFEALVPVVCRAGQLDFAVGMCKDSIRRKCGVAAEVLQGVIDGLAKESRIEEARELVRLARSNLYSKKSLRMPSASSVRNGDV